MIYYGRGAHENYADRLSSADLGLYEQRVADQYHDEYVRPQESGTKGGLRWWTVVDSAGTGLTILADAPFSGLGAAVRHGRPRCVEFPAAAAFRDARGTRCHVREL